LDDQLLICGRGRPHYDRATRRNARTRHSVVRGDGLRGFDIRSFIDQDDRQIVLIKKQVREAEVDSTPVTVRASPISC
jgi:hypothetical protein